MQQYSILGDYIKAVEAGLTSLKLFDIHINICPTEEEIAGVYKEVKASLLALPAVYPRVAMVVKLTFLCTHPSNKYLPHLRSVYM